jgi:formylglycine-generating enzyme required for sulfatase activity
MMRRLRLSLIASCIFLASVGCDGQTIETAKRTSADASGSGDTGGSETDAGEDSALDTLIADADAGADTDVDAAAAADVDAAADADATADTGVDTESDTAPATRPCVVPNGTGTETWTGSDYGSCTATACESGYHIESGACTNDTRTCSPLPANTTDGTQVWTGSAYGSCTATACASGYTVVGGVCGGGPGAGSPGAACTLHVECDSGNCATGPTGTANDRCAPIGMNYIPAGTFTMGSPLTEVRRSDNEEEHTVTISRGFFIDQTEVTQGQWKARSGGTNPSWFQSPTGTDQTISNSNDSGPAEEMDWYAAVAFANARSAARGLTSCYTLTGCTDAANGWKDGVHSGCTGAIFAGLTCTGYRLPTESEWEYAARAGTTEARYGPFDSVGWFINSGGLRTQAVAGKTANNFGLYDMLGNVEEWTGDWYSGDWPGTVTDPTGPTVGSDRVFRGGSWFSQPWNARAASRFADMPYTRENDRGFRLAMTAP